MIEALVFDNDRTLYEVRPEFRKAVVEKFHDVLSQRLGITLEAAKAERQRIYATHGSTVAGVVREYGWAPSDFVQETYLAVPLDGYVAKNPELANMLAGLPQRKVVLTNNHSQFARRILRQVGIEDQFEQVFGEEHFGYELKPADRPFQLAQDYFSGLPASNIMLVEDSENNINAATGLGFETFDVAPTGIFGLPEAILHSDLQKIMQAHSLGSVGALVGFDRQATTGNRFFRCAFNGQAAVLKYGRLSKRGVSEIGKNVGAYAKMDQMGLAEYNPLLASGQGFEILQFLETDLCQRVNGGTAPETQYILVQNHLRKMFISTLREDRPAALAFLESLFGDEPQKRYLKDYLLKFGLIRSSDVELLKEVQARFEQISPSYVAFTAGGELQPQHFCFSGDQLKIIDLHEPVEGNSIIDLAILSELFDAYGLKNAEEGKRIMCSLMFELGTAMHLSRAQVSCLAALGKIRQGTLSARFRFETNPAQAQQQADKVVRSMEEIINANLS